MNNVRLCVKILQKFEQKDFEKATKIFEPCQELQAEVESCYFSVLRIIANWLLKLIGRIRDLRRIEIGITKKR